MPERIHRILIREHVGDALVENSSIDGSALEGREKTVRKKEPKKRPPKKRGRKKKGEEGVVAPDDIPALDRYTRMSPGEIAKAIPQGCDWGGKRNSQGNVEGWRGFKIHIHSAEGEIPLAVLVTSASVHDSQPVPSLVKRTKERCPNVLSPLTDRPMMPSRSPGLSRDTEASMSPPPTLVVGRRFLWIRPKRSDIKNDRERSECFPGSRRNSA